MRRLLFFTLLCLAAAPALSQSFSDFIIRVNIAPEQRRQFMVDSMLATVQQYPYPEADTLVWYFYKGAAQEVSVAGDMNNWSDTRSPLQRLSTTDLWYRSERYASDARLDYKYVVSGNWILDPRNPYTVSGGYGPNSELRMPGYEPPEEILHHNGVLRGTIIDTTFTAATLNNSRPVKIYLPAGYESSTERYPLVLFHDGLDYLALGSAANILDNLIHERRIPPCIAVFVPAINRNPEYSGSQIDSFTDFIVDTVIKRVDARYRTRTDPAARAMIGSSNGGNIGLYIAMKHPEVFGNVGAQSSNIIASIASEFRDGPLLPLRLYLDLGTYDIAVLIPMVRGFVPILQSKGYDYLYREFNEGHSWGNWRAHIDDALVFFFSRLLSSAEPAAPATEGFLLGPAWPNPASEHVTLPFVLARGGQLRVSLHDVLGRELRVLHEGDALAGATELGLSFPSLRPGTYFLRAATPLGVRSQLLLIK